MRIETLPLNNGTIGFRFTIKNSKNKVLIAGIAKNHVTKNKWLKIKSLKTFNQISIGYYTLNLQKTISKTRKLSDGFTTPRYFFNV